MPWKVVTTMSARKRFIGLALGTSSFSELCRRFGISRRIGYKWLSRYRDCGDSGLQDQSRRPHRSPQQTPAEMEGKILEVRREHPAWGARKIRCRLEREGQVGLPAPSTITEILRRQGRITAEDSAQRKPLRRFTYPHPNDLWQMDFKGEIPVGGRLCPPLTMLDDHSRFSLLLQACPDKSRETVERHLRESFEQYGLPRRMLFDNGGPWAPATRGEMTALKVWLLRLGIDVIFSGVKHPQTLGKEERFHRTLKAECLGHRWFESLSELQGRLDDWQLVYNFERPHEALGMQTPGEVYQISPRSYPDRLPPIEYGPQDAVRMVWNGRISFQGRRCRIGHAFEHYPVGVRATTTDGVFDVYFGERKIRRLDLRNASDVEVST